MVNYTTITYDTGVFSQTVRGYFEILEDTLRGRFLLSYRRRPKRRVVAAEKSYFGDVGAVNFLAKRGTLQPGGEMFGKAFENRVFHDLCCYDSHRSCYADFFCWRLSSGIEVDFVVNHIDCTVEAKVVNRVRTDHTRGLRELKVDHPEVRTPHPPPPTRPNHRRRYRAAPPHYVLGTTMGRDAVLNVYHAESGVRSGPEPPRVPMCAINPFIIKWLRQEPADGHLA